MSSVTSLYFIDSNGAYFLRAYSPHSLCEPALLFKVILVFCILYLRTSLYLRTLYLRTLYFCLMVWSVNVICDGLYARRWYFEYIIFKLNILTRKCSSQPDLLTSSHPFSSLVNVQLRISCSFCTIWVILVCFSLSPGLSLHLVLCFFILLWGPSTCVGHCGNGPQPPSFTRSPR